MSYTGTVEGGVVKLPPDAALPDGTVVKVEPIEVESTTTFARQLKEIASKVSGLPGDLAAQHDHYIHGTPKR